MKITFIDTETTGLDLLEHEIIDIAALKLEFSNDQFLELERFESKVKPNYIERASVEALKINGYTEKKWKDSVLFNSIAPTIKYLIETSDYLIGQNLIFDYRFINKAFDVYNLDRPVYPQYFDTKWMAEQLVYDKKLKRSSLDFLCEHYQIENHGRPHTAMADVLRTADIFKILIKDCNVLALDFSNPYDPYRGK